jgi:cellulose synthase operon protein C
VLRGQPNAAGVLRALAQAHIVNREPALAEEALRRAMDVAPDDTDAAVELAKLLFQTGRATQARAVLAELVRKRPDDADAQSALFRACLSIPDLACARAAADAVVALDPKRQTGLLYQGLLAEAENRLGAAAAAFERAAELEPRAPEPLQGLVRVLVAQGRRAEAYRQLDASAARDGENALPLTIKGEMLFADRRLREADESFAAAGARSPRWWMPVRGRAAVAYARGDAASAIRVLEDALPRVDQPLAVRLELAMRYEAAGRIDDAARQYEEVLRAAPDMPLAANNLAMLLVTHRRDAGSLERAAQLATVLADSPVPHFQDTYGWTRLQVGDTRGALAALEKAAAGAPNEPLIRYHLAMAQIAAEQGEKARANLRAALAAPAAFPGRDKAQSALDSLPSNP